MYKNIFTKTSLLFLSFFCFSVFCLAEPVNASSEVKPVVASADLTKAAVPAVSTASTPAAPPKVSGETAPPLVEQPDQAPIKFNNDEKNKLLVISKFVNFDYRKLNVIKWPPVDLLKEKTDTNLDLVKDQIKIKQIINQRCLDYVSAYQESLKSELNPLTSATAFADICEIYSEIIKNEPLSESNPIFKIPNDGLIRRLDQVAYTQYRSNTPAGIKRLKTVESLIKAHENSLFGMLGIPLNFTFLVTQVILVLVLVISCFLLYKKITD